MIRSFLAFDISEEIKKSLGGLITTIRSQTEGVKWVKPENFHVTAKFFGNIDEEKMIPLIQEVVEKNIKGVEPVLLSCQGVGAFPTWQRPRVLWAGLKGESASLIQLQKSLDEGFSKIGFSKEDREFKMHLTMGRLTGRPKYASWMGTLEKMRDSVFGQVGIDHLTLYKSQLTKQGPIYTPLNRFYFSTTSST